MPNPISLKQNMFKATFPRFGNDLPVDFRFEIDLISLKTHMFMLFTKSPDSYVY